MNQITKILPENCKGCKSREAKRLVDECKEKLEQTEKQIDYISARKEEIKKSQIEATAANEIIKEKVESAGELLAKAIAIENNTSLKIEAIQEQIDEAIERLNEAEEIAEQVGVAKKIIAESTTEASKIKTITNHFISKKTEIDELYSEIFGEEIENDDGETEQTEGLKDRLENSYQSIEEKISSFSTKIDGAIAQLKLVADEKIALATKKFEESQTKHETEAKKVTEELYGLLPGSMAKGLSHAYEEKKQNEEKSLKRHENQFHGFVLLMLIISIIPASISFSLIQNGAGIEGMLSKSPQILMAMLPVYLPALWLAYSSNKQRNLSKRLIEEYTHKAALGNTFSGLSKQIDDLPHESAMKDDLRARLLYSVLEVSSENPGKLITDYNRADHPLIDVLEKSNKLSDSLESLSKIPGIERIAKAIEKKIEGKKSEIEEKVVAATIANEEIENKSGKNS